MTACGQWLWCILLASRLQCATVSAQAHQVHEQRDRKEWKLQRWSPNQAVAVAAVHLQAATCSSHLISRHPFLKHVKQGAAVRQLSAQAMGLTCPAERHNLCSEMVVGLSSATQSCSRMPTSTVTQPSNNACQLAAVKRAWHKSESWHGRPNEQMQQRQIVTSM